MRAPDRGSSLKDSSLKDITTELLKQYELADALFLRIRNDPGIDKIWKKIVDDNPLMNTAPKHELFLKDLMKVCNSTFVAYALAKFEAFMRATKKNNKYKKTLARSLSSKTSTRELLALLRDANTVFETVAEIEKEHEAIYQHRLYPILNIRSDHKRSRKRTVFMRMASRLMYRITGKWHDDEVADLTDIAFPNKETSVRMVQSARQSMRRTA
jgi:hypothetical protein